LETGDLELEIFSYGDLDRFWCLVGVLLSALCILRGLSRKFSVLMKVALLGDFGFEDFLG
jgi:hypothetical protein